MASATDFTDGGRTPKGPYIVHLMLREGFHEHTVLITVDDRTVYQAVGLTTDPSTERAGAIAVPAADHRARLAVSVTPGNLTAAFDLDVLAHPYVAISLVGEGTVAFETSASPFS
jgi:hypothetical protein